jgi:CobQ-like glutamine amidotransferase family enzyme
MYSLTICHLYPDILNLYGDRGNVIALQKRCLWRGIDVGIQNISLGRPFSAEQCDILFIGGGQDFEQEIMLEDFYKQHE